MFDRKISPGTQHANAIQSFADGLHMEANVLQSIVIENLASVKNVRWLHHQFVNAFIVQFL